MNPSRRRTAALALAAATGLVPVAAQGADAAPAHPSTHAPARPAAHRAPAAQRATWLVVADAKARQVSVLDARTGRRTGSIARIAVGDHAGILQLGRGRIALMDESRPRLDVVTISATGTPRITATVPVPNPRGRWERAGWLATDPSHRYVAIGSDFDGETTQQVTVADLATGRSRTVALPVARVATPKGMSTEEVETFLVGSPLRLVVTAGGRLDSYPLDRVLAGGTQHATASAPLSAYPHGPIVDARGTSIGSDTATGVQSVSLTRRGFGQARFTPYHAGTVQRYRPVMAPDGRTSVGTQTGTDSDAATAPVYLTSASVTAGGATTVRIGSGPTSRATAASGYAAAAVHEPHGDRLVTVARTRSGYNGRGGSLALTAATPGSTAVRFVAATPDGRRLWVTRPGTGQVVEVAASADGRTLRTVRTLDAGSSLADGGHLAVVTPSQAPFDLSAR